jgi:hypothetical protein
MISIRVDSCLPADRGRLRLVGKSKGPDVCTQGLEKGLAGHHREAVAGSTLSESHLPGSSKSGSGGYW